MKYLVGFIKILSWKAKLSCQLRTFEVSSVALLHFPLCNLTFTEMAMLNSDLL